MRPAILFPLFAPITSLKGIGPRLGPLYQRLCGEHIVDLLWHLPVGSIDRSYSPELKYADKDRVVTLVLDIAEHNPPPERKPNLPYKIVGVDSSDEQITITYFNVKGDYLSRMYPTDHKVVVSGMLERYRGGWNMSHPDFVVPIERRDEIPRCEPVYALTEGLSGKMLRRSVQLAFEKTPELPEWNDPALLAREKWLPWKHALQKLHNPTADVSVQMSDDKKSLLTSDICFLTSGERKRLAYDELLADQLALAVIRNHHRAGKGCAIPGTEELRRKLLETLPFKLTSGQGVAIGEISADMAAPKRMLRLLQGDVGSGKTIVALFAMLQAAESGMQAALMAPTEILAKQHYARLKQFLEPIGIEVGLLVGRSRGGERQPVLDGLASGSLKLVVGTHALFQEDVKFADLALAVVDEQHKFGVNERLRLSDKGRGVDILVMTATPIPRTLTLTAFGDMDVSQLPDKPAGRQPIDTRLVNLDRLDEMMDALGHHIAKGGQAYWVCPLVMESELSDLAAATERAKFLAARLGSRPLSRTAGEGGAHSRASTREWEGEGVVANEPSPASAAKAASAPSPAMRERENVVGLVHGKMAAEAKDKVMAAFASGAIKVLVATTVIEVGVDVPNATLMIVEHAERFGLAQLHQLRGRVGRGAEKSSCVLLYKHPAGEMAKARLKMLRETEDGFRIAEEDLRLRGPGELLGKRQSGAPEFRLADLAAHRDLLSIAHDDAKLILHNDPDLTSERGKALRILLYLFERDAAVPLLRAG